MKASKTLPSPFIYSLAKKSHDLAHSDGSISCCFPNHRQKVSFAPSFLPSFASLLPLLEPLDEETDLYKNPLDEGKDLSW